MSEYEFDVNNIDVVNRHVVKEFKENGGKASSALDYS
jgi:hypothetical protein